jgi:hypothetical protein
MRCPIWSRRSGMTTRIPLWRRALRVEGWELALSAITQSGRRRGRAPAPRPGTLMSASSGSSCGLSPACPAVSRTDSGRPRVVDAEMGLGAPAAAGATQGMIGWRRSQNLVIRSFPLCQTTPGACMLPRRVGARGPQWSRPTPATPTRPRHAHRLAPWSRSGPTCRPWTTGQAATTPFARPGNQPAGLATAHQSGTASRSPQQPVDDRSTDPHAEASDPAATARSEPTSRHSTALCSRLTPDTCTSPSVQPTRVHPSQPDQHLTGWSERLRVGVEPEGGRVGFADP